VNSKGGVMNKLIECVPNVSEGRRKDIIETLKDEILSVKDIKLLDYSSDFDHNRSVFTFVGSPKNVLEAAYRLASKSLELVDLNKHKGEHPRIGAIDVIPFIPIRDVTMNECVLLAIGFGRRLGENLNLPVYLYEEAATTPHRRNLANIRRGEFEGLYEKMKNPAWKPDFGPDKPHPTAGATVVGAREPLIAFNVNLNTKDVSIAKMIAKAIREKDGGFPKVKALGLELKDKDLTQVSMNLTNYKVTPVYKVFDKIVELAKENGVEVVESELIGLIPIDAISQIISHYLKLPDFKSDRILEYKIFGD
jgi:glutamate formiminotransferase